MGCLETPPPKYLRAGNRAEGDGVWKWQRTLKVINLQKKGGWKRLDDLRRYVDASSDWSRSPLQNIKRILE